MEAEAEQTELLPLMSVGRTVDEVANLRTVALNAAVELHRDREHHNQSPGDAVVAAAEKFFRFLYLNAEVKHIALVPGMISAQDGSATRQPDQGENPMQLHDDEQVTYTVEATDAKGQEVTGETINFSVDDTSVAAITVSADGTSATIVAGTTGSAVLTATVGALTVTEAIDVIAGDATAISLVPGEVTKQDAAAPPQA
jgi:hypothetical protein